MTDEYVEGESREMTIERFQLMGITGDALEMCVAQQRGEWFSDYEVTELCPRCEDAGIVTEDLD